MAKKDRSVQSKVLGICLCGIALLGLFSFLWHFFSSAGYAGLDLTAISNMQELTPQICTASTVGAENTLTDIRDEKTYLVRKLADNNCWMIQNLDLDLSSSITLTSDDTDLNSKDSWTPHNSTQATAGIAWTQDGGDTAQSMDPGKIYFSDGIGIGTADAEGNLQGVTSGQPWEFIGNYYNRYAATAGSGTAIMRSASAADSICPKGWRLPTNAGAGSFNTLLSTYNLQDNGSVSAVKLLQAPLNFVRSGAYYWSGQVYGQGMGGAWWSASATQSTATHAYILAISDTQVTPQAADYKGSGLAIRCIARSV